MNKQSLITILLAVLMGMTGVKAFAYDIAVANTDGITIYYVWANDEKTELAVSQYYSSSYRYSGNLVIPESVVYEGNTYKVTSIGDWAFHNCSDLTSVTIPTSVTSIGYGAFSGCSGLTSVSIPTSVTSFGDYAFYRCGSLPAVTIPNSVTTIGNYAFQECIGLTSVTFPNSLTSIGSSAFQDCTGLTSVAIPNSVTSIGRDAFYGTAWYNNQPDGLVYAGKVAYKYKGEMPANTHITLKDGTLGIAVYAFFGFSNLTSMTIPNSVKIIEGRAFENCNGLTAITIPNSVTYIGDYAFYFCSSLTSVTIPNSVTSIGLSAFYGCSSLTSVTIPNSVTSIGSSAFRDCSSLTAIISLITAPFAIYDILSSDNYSQTILIVPKNTKEVYQTIDGWNKFTNIIEVGEGGIFGQTFNSDNLN